MIEILDAVRNALRTGPKKLTNPVCDRRNCNVESREGNPPPSAPEAYISIVEARVTAEGQKAEMDIFETHYVDVVLSIRVVGPIDRYDEVYRRESMGLKKIERQILAAVHGQQWIRQQASIMNDGEVEYLNPLFYTGRQKTEVKPVDWSSEVTNDKSKGWLVRRYSFAGMQRVIASDSILPT